MTIGLDERRKALEEAFFQKENDEALGRIRQHREEMAAVGELCAATGVGDEGLLEALLGQGVTGETIAALSLVPVVAVAWADGKIDRGERTAILQAATRNGIEAGQPAHELLERWLSVRPADQLLTSWGDYAKEIFDELGEEERIQFAEDVLERAYKVARAAGGILGIGAVSDDERAVIARLRAMLAP
jgi:tellurite resistance protein